MHDNSTVMSGNHRNVIRRLTGVLGNLQKLRLFARAFKESLGTDSWTTDEIRAYVDRIIRLIDDFEPDWLHVYPSAASLLGNILRRTGKRLTCHPKGVLCGSETVYPWQVELFADVFDCRTFSHYGHGELVLLGGWCEGTRMFHFLPNHGYVELLDDSGQVVSDPQVTGEQRVVVISQETSSEQ